MMLKWSFWEYFLVGNRAGNIHYILKVQLF